MGAHSCATPLTARRTQKATTQIVGDLGPNLSLLCEKWMAWIETAEKEGGRERERGGGYRRVGIEALGAYPQ